MAVASYAASVQGVALRVTRLDPQGFPMTGPEDVYVTRAFMRVSFTPEYEDGDEITEKNAAGEVCVTYKAPDTLKRATMEIAICDPDPEFTELLSGGVLLKYDETGKPPVSASGPTANFQYPGATVGYASVKVGESPNPNGVGVEVWSLAIKDGARDSDLPFYRWVFPKATLRPSGDRVIENGLLANTFEGWSVGNIHFGTGPADDWYWPDATDRPFLYARDYVNPWTGTNGWYAYPNPPFVSDTGVPEKDPATGMRLVEYGVTNVATPTNPTNPRSYLLYEAENPTYGQTYPTAVTGATQGVQGAQAFSAPTGPAGPGARRAAPTPPPRPQGPDQAQGAAEQVRPESAEPTGGTGGTGNKSE